MDPLSVIIFDTPKKDKAANLLRTLKEISFVEKIIFTRDLASKNSSANEILFSPYSSMVLNKALQETLHTSYLMLIHKPDLIDINQEEIKQFLNLSEKEKEGGFFYSDHYLNSRSASNITPVINYQSGSIRDDFDFGPVQILSVKHIKSAFEKFGPLSESNWAGLYELRLRLSLLGKIIRISSPLSLLNQPKTEKSHFDYLDPIRTGFHKEMEKTASKHLKLSKAFCSHEFMTVPEDPDPCPVTASIIIPVKNREKTISNALKSALSQKTDFSYNVIIVQNHSTDRTAEKIDSIAATDSRVIQIIPKRKDLGIGGCWNEAVMSSSCGKFVCQLDSDDIYLDEKTLSTIVKMLQTSKYGMVVGSYRVVNFNLEEIPPGIVDHREWTEDNGRNNLLRVNGIGAPRAFPRIMLRKFPFPNVSYGEDYSVSLRISRDFRVGRIFDPLYLCRRWDDNSDAMLSREQANKFAYYKDTLRTEEILARRNINNNIETISK